MKVIKVVLCFLLFSGFIKAENPENGKILFRNYCKACHNIDKNLVGPALKDVHLRRDEDWILAFVKNSTSFIERGDSTAIALFNQFNKIPMPNQKLSDIELKDILSYIKVESETEPEVNRITRPEVKKAAIEPLHFSDFKFWITYTITILIIIGVLYYMVEATSLTKNLQKEE